MESFEWDEQKNEENRKKHGVSFEEAQKVFLDPDYIILEDDSHSTDEKRFFCVGKIEAGILTVRFTYRGEKIRIFGAGYWRKLGKVYLSKQGKL